MFKTLITACNRYLWIFIHPVGQTDRLVFRSFQHRDLVRAFFAGAVVSLRAAGSHVSVNSMEREINRMAAPDWLPDARFLPPRPKRTETKKL